MRISPFFELLLVAGLGSLTALAFDFAINGAASGAMKAASLFAVTGFGATAAAAFGALLVAASGPASVFYFRPLTRRGAFTLAVGAAAVVSILTPAFS